jgi:hypothetical protein
MARRARKSRLSISGDANHEALVSRGLELHEAREYTAALPWFERALLIAPRCPAAICTCWAGTPRRSPSFVN